MYFNSQFDYVFKINYAHNIRAKFIEERIFKRFPRIPIKFPQEFPDLSRYKRNRERLEIRRFANVYFQGIDTLAIL